MPFENPLVAGEELIRPGIRSKDYIEGSKGWRIGRDGTAEYENVAIRKTLAAEAVNTDEILLKGLDVREEFDKRVVSTFVTQLLWDEATVSWPAAATANTLIAKTTTTMLPNHEYRWSLDGVEISTPTAGDVVAVWFRYILGTGTPTASSPILIAGAKSLPPSRGASNNTSAGLSGYYGHAGASEQVITVGVFIQRVVGSGTPYTWADLGGRFYTEDLGLVIPSSGTKYLPASSTVTPQRYTDIWYMGDVQSYQANGSFSPASNSSIYAYQGDGSAVGNPGGNHCGYFFFDHAAIAARLVGATPVGAKIWLDNVHTYSNSGQTCWIGYHWNTGVPSTAINKVERVWSHPVVKGGSFWTPDFGPTLCDAFKNGSARGIIVGYAPDSNVTHYGYYKNCGIALIYDK